MSGGGGGVHVTFGAHEQRVWKGLWNVGVHTYIRAYPTRGLGNFFTRIYRI